MTISAVLPLKACGSYDVNDLKRAHILFTSLSTFMEPGLISELFVVVPQQEVELVKREYSHWQKLNIIVLSEDELLPEFKHYPKMRGWRKQQLVKIAIAEKVANEFYLTLDADVICLKHITEQQLIVDGKALLQYEQRAQHPKWWRSSARLLQMNSDIGPKGVGMTVTPALMSRTVSKQLIQHLTPKSATQNWVDMLCSLHNPSDPRNWWIGRYLNLKWTEYSLYYLCALKLDILDKFHVIAGTDTVPQLLLIHDSHPYENWNVAASFAPDNPGLFCVVGSKTRLPPKQVFERLSPFIQQQPDPLIAMLFEHAM